MNQQKILSFLIGISSFFISLSFVDASDLQIGTIERPPFVIASQTGELSGFSIELWQEISQRIGKPYTFKTYEAFSEMLDDTQGANNDLSIANISITSEREKTMDFSNSIFDSGLALMILDTSLEKRSFLQYVLTFPMILGLFSLVCIPVVGYLIIPRKKLKKGKYAYGFLYILIASSILSTLFTSYSVQSLSDTSYNIANLSEKKVGVISASTGEKFADNFSINTTSFATIQELYTALGSGDIEVLVHDFPVLQYHAEQNTQFEVVGEMFKKEKYGIIFPKGSELREEVDRALLDIREEGVYDLLYLKYFGEE